MKTVETCISEQRFLSRIESLCVKKAKFDKGYADREVFVVKQNNNTFWIAKHYPSRPREREYVGDCLYCKYSKNQNGHIVVNYNYGKRPMHWIYTVIVFVVGLVLWASVIYDVIVNSSIDLNEILITVLICLVGLVFTFRRSKKEQKVLKEHLLKICNILN